MTFAHKRFLVEQCIGGIVVNFAINAAIGWLIFRGVETAPFTGLTSILGDTLIMAFLLPYMLSFIVTLDTRRKIRAGRFTTLPWQKDSHPLLGRLPDKLINRSLLLGFYGLVAVLPLLAYMHFRLEVTGMTPANFAWFKGILAGVMAAPLMPLVVLRAFGDDQQFAQAPIAETGEQ